LSRRSGASGGWSAAGDLCAAIALEREHFAPKRSHKLATAPL